MNSRAGKIPSLLEQERIIERCQSKATWDYKVCLHSSKKEKSQCDRTYKENYSVCAEQFTVFLNPLHDSN